MLYPKNDFALVGLETSLILAFVHLDGIYSVIIIINIPVLKLLCNFRWLSVLLGQQSLQIFVVAVKIFPCLLFWEYDGNTRNQVLVVERRNIDYAFFVGREIALQDLNTVFRAETLEAITLHPRYKLLERSVDRHSLKLQVVVAFHDSVVLAGCDYLGFFFNFFLAVFLFVRVEVDASRQQFEVPQELIDHIKAEGEKQKITPKDDEEYQKALSYLRLQLKALIARDLWNMDEYFAIFNESNDAVQRALQLIDKSKK